ncbi:glycosyltransferase family 4 protein [Paenibacillus sp. N3.4]|uniref:glycosyltransferase family 4 protein n=1 Tax=Paenibacillus sp. N3.4 TaxID=2603222 RepID=UPI0011C819DE|nr:glycosyltransferase family 4 protein [Paenibacillus sp. N3.4]TXK72425.1 glycosyltransferase [Paenibacillus sp. N3.4]
MNRINNHLNIVFLGTSLPRECGIATFTQDLMDQFAQKKNFNKPRIIAVNNKETYNYDDQVIMQIDQQQVTDYVEAADYLNTSNVDLLVIQHEFGIYGGENGEYVIPFVERLNIPFVVIFHTVLTTPSPKQRHIMNRIAQLSAKVVTMAQSTVTDLHVIYEIDLHKIVFIHHGVPYVETKSRSELKEQFGFTDRKIISTFGFLSPGKGIEYGIEAMRGVIAQHPESLYIIWGKTHPVVKKETGEVYRQKLTEQIKELGLVENVLFVDKLLTQEEVIQSLVMSDIYMTPYLGKDQAVSGTLAYGVGYGRVIVSTPYRYAEEMLAGGRGLLAEFRDSSSLETSISKLLDNPSLVKEMEASTLALGKTMMWGEIAKRYAAVFEESISTAHFSKRSVI